LLDSLLQEISSTPDIASGVVIFYTVILLLIQL